MTHTLRTLIFTLALFSSGAGAVALIELKGVFSKKAAVLMVDGKQLILDRGETAKDITLEEVRPDSVVLWVNGERQEVFLSRQFGADYKPPAIKAVNIPIGEGGHYWANGTINGKLVKFVVDTGATLVAMNMSTAKTLGVDYENGEKANMNTANGSSEARIVQLDKVTLGQITQHNVKAIVALNDSLPFVLLGNSFLNKVNITQRNSVMTLETNI